MDCYMENGLQMNKQNLTANRVSEFACEAGKQQSFLWDARIPGLGVRATANGAKSYIFQSVHGRCQGPAQKHDAYSA